LIPYLPLSDTLMDEYWVRVLITRFIELILRVILFLDQPSEKRVITKYDFKYLLLLHYVKLMETWKSKPELLPTTWMKQSINRCFYFQFLHRLLKPVWYTVQTYFRHTVSGCP